MWTIQSENVSIQMNHRALLEQVNIHIASNEVLMLLGPNGIGKSTLIRCLNGQLRPDKGSIIWRNQGNIVPTESWYAYFSQSSPAMELYPDLTIQEMIHLYASFKKLNLTEKEIRHTFQLQSHWNIRLRSLSSGWLDRVKLALALATDAPVLFLDEPTSHLDIQMANQALEWIETFRTNKIVIWASNLTREFERYPEHLILGR